MKIRMMGGRGRGLGVHIKKQFFSQFLCSLWGPEQIEIFPSVFCPPYCLYGKTSAKEENTGPNQHNLSYDRKKKKKKIEIEITTGQRLR